MRFMTAFECADFLGLELFGDDFYVCEPVDLNYSGSGGVKFVSKFDEFLKKQLIIIHFRFMSFVKIIEVC